MSDKTIAEESLSREEVADRLESLANQFRGEHDADVAVGNKTVRLSPPSTIEYAITVEERSSMLGGRKEAIGIKMNWKPADE
ncbi:amphi-Trp domain-containing protein [Halegenticoccus soli]|uniref:amphi-Trp domain-containing protein n=1 Tax=Halegenticoccus soli TaxID=1985678 RepID=UPI000C6D0E93|nr:amphi-Trp domain-containing protein [Halegenticoccus soli]